MPRCLLQTEGRRIEKDTRILIGYAFLRPKCSVRDDVDDFWMCARLQFMAVTIGVVADGSASMKRRWEVGVTREHIHGRAQNSR
jgi:hypothetical protein